MERIRRNYQFLIDCTRSTGPKIRAMTDAARPITWTTFRRYVTVHELRRHPLFAGYSYRGELLAPDGQPTIPRHLKDDIGVSFYRSTYEGKPCVYIEHSRIEHIFCPATEEREDDDEDEE